MAVSRVPSISRRVLLAAPLAALPAAAFAARGKVVTMLGDSITAGYGLAAADALPAQLHLALERLGVANVMRAAGVSGDTTGDAARRLDFSVQPNTAVVVVALGGADMLQGVDPKVTRANLDRILTRLKQRHMGVVLAGVAAPPELGRSYARDFEGVFRALAKSHGVTLYPNLLAGVAGHPALNQADGLHPNPRGVAIIAKALAPVVARVMAGHG
jgi:acyl-CoA thioesterase-1